MFTLSVIAALSAAVIVDSLILYYPVYPNYVVPKHLQNFERNAPPRVFAKDPNIPSSGIVFLKKNSQESSLNWQLRSHQEESSNRQKLHSDRNDIKQQKLEADTSLLPLLPVKSAEVQDKPISPQRTKNTSTRFYAIFDSKLKQFVTSNEPKPLRPKEKDNKEASISKPYHDGIAQQILLEKGGKVALSSQLTDQLRARSSIPFKSDQRVKSIISKIPDTKITSFNRSGRRIFVIDSDAIIKPPNLFTLLR